MFGFRFGSNQIVGLSFVVTATCFLLIAGSHGGKRRYVFRVEYATSDKQRVATTAHPLLLIRKSKPLLGHMRMALPGCPLPRVCFVLFVYLVTVVGVKQFMKECEQLGDGEKETELKGLARKLQTREAREDTGDPAVLFPCGFFCTKSWPSGSVSPLDVRLAAVVPPQTSLSCLVMPLVASRRRLPTPLVREKCSASPKPRRSTSSCF